MDKPSSKPRAAYFSSGPTCKRPGWTPQALANAWLSRSHRAKGGKARLQEAIDLSAQLGRIPKDYLVGIVPASDTGAVEMALWTMLGARPVTAMAWESFGEGWVTDINKQLKLNATVMKAAYGELPDLGKVNWDHDVIFTWNGTTSGVRVPDGWAPPADRKGLAICDATSAVYAMPLAWERLDVVTWSWQKSLGSEAAHGMLVLSPRAVERLESYTPPWPLPKIFRLTKGGKLDREVFEGSTINTPSMLATEDYIDALKWALNLSYGGKTGLDAIFARSAANLKAVADFVAANDWIGFLPVKPETRSSSSICLKLTAGWFTAKSPDEQAAICKKISSSLETEGAAYDTASYRDAPAGFRFWGGPTVDPADMAIALQWLAWAYDAQRQR